MPLIRRLPKRGFNNAAFHRSYAIVNLSDLSDFKAGTTVNEQLLREARLVRGNVAGIKLLGDGELKHALTIEVDRVSASARAKVEKAGGTIVPPPECGRPDAGPATSANGEGKLANRPAKATKAIASRVKQKKRSSRKG